MSGFDLLLLILIIMFILFLFCIVGYLISRILNFSEVSTKGVSFFQLDTFSRRLTPINPGKDYKYIIRTLSKKSKIPLKSLRN